jgi:hypothetical protein
MRRPDIGDRPRPSAPKNPSHRDLVPGVLGLQMPGKTEHGLESMLALVERRSLTGPFDDRLRANKGFLAVGGKTNEVAQVVWS